MTEVTRSDRKQLHLNRAARTSTAHSARGAPQRNAMTTSLLLLLALVARAASSNKHIVVIVADDLGRNDLGIRNAHASGPRTISPNIDALIAGGLTLSSYHTFKICSPSRASTFTGRYPWGAGFYVRASRHHNIDTANTTLTITSFAHRT